MVSRVELLSGSAIAAGFIEKPVVNISGKTAKSTSSGNEWINCAAFSRLARSEEHTSELQSRPHLVCRLLLEKKNNKRKRKTNKRKRKHSAMLRNKETRHRLFIGLVITTRKLA